MVQLSPLGWHQQRPWGFGMSPSYDCLGFLAWGERTRGERWRRRIQVGYEGKILPWEGNEALEQFSLEMSKARLEPPGTVEGVPGRALSSLPTQIILEFRDP